MQPRILADTSVRALRARWVILGDVRLLSAAHLGGNDDGHADSMVIRDRKSGAPLLPGTTLAGALRSHLADHLGGYGSDEDRRVSRLFGSISDQTDPGHQSPIIVFDSIADPTVTEVRDGVSIKPDLGTQREHFKYDLEVVPAGTVFPVRLDLVIAEDGQEPLLLDLVARAVDGLLRGDISLGTKRTRGLGALCGQRFRARRFDLATTEGWRAWAGSDCDDPIGAATEPWPPAQTSHTGGEQRRRLTAEVNLELDAALLIGSPGLTADAPDSVHLQSGGRSVVPGTSLAGVLRQRALRIATLVRRTQGDGEAFVEGLFGPIRTDRAAASLFASRLRVSESSLAPVSVSMGEEATAGIDDDSRERTTRIRIDRFTQGVSPGAMLEEEVRRGGRFLVRLELRDPRPGEAGLLLLLLKDLLSGDLPIGGTTAAGRGVVHGEGWVLPHASKARLPLRNAAAAEVEVLDEMMRELRSEPNRNAEGVQS
jgi:CRISPR/Cas system CSM-associated protein Csm3 (group 7 of RAMP superfamily)